MRLHKGSESFVFSWILFLRLGDTRQKLAICTFEFVRAFLLDHIQPFFKVDAILRESCGWGGDQQRKTNSLSEGSSIPMSYLFLRI